MHGLYLVSVWLHIVAATAWVGGILFLVLVVVPWMRTQDRAAGARLLRDTGARFRTVGWWVFGIALVTGTFQLWMRGVRLGSFVDPAWLGSSFGRTVIAKLAVFAVVLVISGIHDFVHGPRATAAIVADPRSPAAERARKTASHLGRLNVLLALTLVLLGAAIVRGWP